MSNYNRHSLPADQTSWFPIKKIVLGWGLIGQMAIYLVGLSIERTYRRLRS